MLDTTVYRADPRREKAAFKSLALLAGAGILKLYIPDVVRREFISQQNDQNSKPLNELGSSLSSLGRRPLPKAVADFLDDLKTRLEAMTPELEAFVEQEFDNWVKITSAEILPIQDSHGERVIEAYFGGHAPFRQAKWKDDLPDAYIWQTIIDLSRSHAELYVVSADKGMLAGCSGRKGVHGFSSLEEFVESKPFQTVLQTHFATSALEEFLAMLYENSGLATSLIEGLIVEVLVGETVQSDEIPDDNGEGRILEVDSPTDVKLEIDQAIDHGEGLIVIPLSLRTEALLNYAIFRGDYHLLSIDKIKKIDLSDRNRHYFDADEYYQLEVEGTVSVEALTLSMEPSKSSEEVARQFMSNIELKIDSIESLTVVDEYEEI